MSGKKIFVYAFLIFAMGYGVGLLSPHAIWYIKVDMNKTCGLGEYIYYIFSVFGVIGTFLAVFVALFKESILRFFHCPKCEISLLDEGVTENIDREQQNPQADSYDCILKIDNVGNDTALSCEVFINKVLFAKKAEQEKRPLRNFQGKKKLYWDAAFLDIPPRISKEVRLLSIFSPNNFGTPSVAEKKNGLYLDLNGFQLDIKNAQKGIWEIEYYLSYKNGDFQYFTIEVVWDGSWKDRKTEMTDVLKIKLK